jgi:hypothetical protein
MIARRAHRIGVAAQWASPVAVGLRNTALRLLPFIVRPLPSSGPGLDRMSARPDPVTRSR